MMTQSTDIGGFHHYTSRERASDVLAKLEWQPGRFTYTFHHHFHPFVTELVRRLNLTSVEGLLDVNFQASLVKDFFAQTYAPPPPDEASEVRHFPKRIDLDPGGGYSNYNWELGFHAPFTIAVHLSKHQRFAEAQRWFHYIFDPTSDDQTVEAPERYWRFLGFRQEHQIYQIDDLLALLSKPDVECTPEELERKRLALAGYEAARADPFQPHAVARTRAPAYQYAVVMKYLDNLIAWGDSLFSQDTAESINEATQLYVLAANILGPRPQEVPPRGTVRPKTYAQLKKSGIDPFGNALVELEGRFPFNLALPNTRRNTDPQPLLGLARTLYFCVPRNDKLLGYWDLVADRLFKIRHCMTIEGVVRQLPLFEPPLDPGMLVKAAAAGIDVSSLVSGRNQPSTPVRASLLIHKALEICAEVRALGAALLAALEKKDAEALFLLRQGHETKILQLAQDVKFLQRKEAEEATEGLLRAREGAFTRYRHYQLLLGRNDSELAPLKSITLRRDRMTEKDFDELYRQLVAAYAGGIPLQAATPPAGAGVASPAAQAGAQGTGDLGLSTQEAAELNVHLPAARERMEGAGAIDTATGVLAMLPNFGLDFHFWGLGGHLEFGGPSFAAVGRILSGKERGLADQENYAGGRAAKVGGYERRTHDYALQSDLAAHDLMHNGRQILAALIREQLTRHEYDNHHQAIAQSLAVEAFLRRKFTGAELHTWMQAELSRLYYECYRMAFDVARKAEQSMKHELMRPELDATDFVRFDHFDGGRKGLLAGEALYLDVKRMELVYHDHNRREYELTTHVSLAQLDPLDLLRLKATGRCEITVPEWLYDLNCPGHYLRRIKNVSMSIPAVAGPYTSVHCTLALLKSTLRRSPALGPSGYARQGTEDQRFVDYTGTVQSIVTSGGNTDSGLFETNLHDERYLPFEGAGAETTWRVELPAALRSFDYQTISDIVLHIRYTAREGGAPLREAAVATVKEAMKSAGSARLVRLFSLRYDFPSDWYAFATGTGDFTTTIGLSHFPYLAQAMRIQIDEAGLYRLHGDDLLFAAASSLDLETMTEDLHDERKTKLRIPADHTMLVRDESAEVFLLLRYSLT
ncbi:hypothetical protein [Nonomuraea sp. B19D2]|uniref:Tc toxin subunit A-related protein n=1 Tax=Nonomuraea sp. B19D2 TaxID=3159561 RepID=UPI0032DB0BB3